MDQTTRFVILENITRYSEQYERCGCPEKQAPLRRLIVEEERKFAHCSERLDVTDRHIERAAYRITTLEHSIALSQAHDDDTVDMERRLANLKSFRALLYDLRKIWADLVEKGDDQMADRDSGAAPSNRLDGA